MGNLNDSFPTINPIHADGLVGLFTPVEPSGFILEFPLSLAMAQSVEIHTQIAVAETINRHVKSIPLMPQEDLNRALALIKNLYESQHRNDLVLYSYGLVRNFGNERPLHLLPRPAAADGNGQSVSC